MMPPRSHIEEQTRTPRFLKRRDGGTFLPHHSTVGTPKLAPPRPKSLMSEPKGAVHMVPTHARDIWSIASFTVCCICPIVTSLRFLTWSHFSLSAFITCFPVSRVPFALVIP